VDVTHRAQGKGKKLPPDHPGYAPIAPEVTVAKVRRREEKFARRAKRKGEKAAKKARLLAALPPGYMEAKAAKREDARRKRKEKTREMRALGFEREGKGRSPRTVRKEKIALKLLSEAGGGVAVGTGANMGEVGLNRMAKRMVGRGRGKV